MILARGRRGVCSSWPDGASTNTYHERELKE
jgi:hypothetical protein